MRLSTAFVLCASIAVTSGCAQAEKLYGGQPFPNYTPKTNTQTQPAKNGSGCILTGRIKAGCNLNNI